MPTCAVLGCKLGNGRSCEKVQAFPLPKDSPLKNQWISCINRENYVHSKNTRVCQKHFKDIDFVPEIENKDKRGRKKRKRTLQPDAIPSIDLQPLKLSKAEIATAVKNDHPYSAQEESMIIVQENVQNPEEDTEIIEFNSVEIESQNEDADKDAIIVDQKKIIANLRKEKLKSDLIIEKVKTIFDDDQMEKLLAPATSTIHYSMEHITKGVKTYFTCGKSGYLFIRNELKLPLPSVSTLQNHLAKICCEPGSLHDFFKIMEEKVSCMEENDRFCSMSLDEMSIQPKVEYDLSTQSYTGYVTLPLSKAQQKKVSLNSGNPEKQLAYHAFSGK